MNPDDAQPPADLETDPRFPSGKWVGFWTQRIPFQAKPRQEMLLTFRAGEVRGEGRDMVGRFHIRGFYSTEDGKCRFTKKYVGLHDVYYDGFNEGKGIWGTWSIDPLRGGFHIWPEELGDPTDSHLAAEADLPVEAIDERKPVTVG